MNRFVTRTMFALGAIALLGMASGSLWAAGTPAGTSITNQATVDYTDVNGNTLQTLSNVVTTVVSQVASVTVAPDRSSSATPGDTIYYAHDVTNNGNGSDTFDLTAVSSNGWSTVIYADNDASGTFSAGDTVITDTGSMAANGVQMIIVEVTVPAGTASGTSDTLTVTATSQFNSGVQDSATDTTTINAPNVSAVKSVLPAGPQPPGTVLTYSIVVTNNGTSDANAVVLTDLIPANTTYVAGSMTLNGAGKTDVALDDEGDFNVTTAGGITMSIGVLAPSAAATVTFQVTID